jgi:hypothetical protein
LAACLLAAGVALATEPFRITRERVPQIVVAAGMRPFVSRAAADGLAAAIRRVFWDAAKGRFKGAVEKDFYWGEANGLALAVKFCTADEAAAIRKTLVKHPHGKFQALYVRGLYEYGYADDAVVRIYEHGWDDVLEPSWPGPRLTSECMHLHTKGWGDEAHPDTCVASLYTNYVLGIAPLEPGFRAFAFNPLACELVDSASGEVPTPHGPIRAAWWHENGRLRWNVSAPDGVSMRTSPRVANAN